MQMKLKDPALLMIAQFPLKLSKKMVHVSLAESTLMPMILKDLALPMLALLKNKSFLLMVPAKTANNSFMLTLMAKHVSKTHVTLRKMKL